MTGTPKCDFHIHTHYLRCANETMQVPAIVAECDRLGVKSIGITDHLNSLDKLDLHVLIKRDIELLNPEIDIYFGVELNFMSADGEFAFNPDVKEQYGFQFAIGGIHSTYLETYDLKKLVDIQHRHHLRTCQDPLVNVLVHPYWFGRNEFDRNGWPWFDTMGAVPESYARELGQAAVETGTAIEINAGANLVNSAYGPQYVEEYINFLSIIAGEGASFALGSDAHDIHRLEAVQASWQVAERLKLGADRIWMPDCQPIVSAKN